ncbi:MAG: DUF58 domain-containing protein [Bacillota bacterium]
MDVIALLVAFLAVIWLQMVIFGALPFRKLDYRCDFSVKEAHEGDSIYLVETVHNCKLLPVPWLKVDIHTSRWLDFAGSCSTVAQESRRVTSSFTLRSYQKITRKWKLKCLKRGVFTTENVTLVSGDLLNLYVSSVPRAVNASLVVYPEIVDLDGMFIPVNLMQGDRVVNRWIVDDPFIVAGARDYAAGDPMNRIHWLASARTGKLMVKKNEHTSQNSLAILLNMQSRLYEHEDIINREIAEIGIKVTATLLDRALKDGMSVRFGTNGCVRSDDRQAIFTGNAANKEHTSEIFKILARLIMKNVKDFENFMLDILPSLENTEIIIVTAYLSKRICELADLMAEAGNTVSIILLESEFEKGIKPCNCELYVPATENMMKAWETG